MPVAPTVSVSVRSSSSILASILATPDVGTVITSYELQRSLNGTTWTNLPVLLNSVSEVERDYPFNTATPTKYVSLSGSVNGIPAYTSIQAALDAAVPGDIIAVAPGTYREAVVLRNKNTTPQTPIYIQALDPNNKPVLDGNNGDGEPDVRPGNWVFGQIGTAAMVRIAASYVIWDSIDIRNSRSLGMHLGPWNNNGSFVFDHTEIYYGVKVLRSSILNCGGNSITIHNSFNAYIGRCDLRRNNTSQLQFFPNPQTWGSTITMMGRGVSIIENIIGQSYGEGIHVGSHIKFDDEDFSQLEFDPATGGRVSLSEIEVRDFVIRGNKIFDTYSAQIYVTNCQDGVIEQNICYSTNDTNYWYKDGSGNPIYPNYNIAFGSESLAFPPALIVPTTKFVGARNVTVRNNVMSGAFFPFIFAQWTGNQTNNIKVQNNTIFNSRGGGIQNGQTLSGITFENNLVYDAEGDICKFGWNASSSSVYRNNLFSDTPRLSNGTEVTTLRGPNDIVNFNVGLTNPNYVPTTATYPSYPVFDTNSFKLLPNSPAVGAGVLNDVTTDFFGNPRNPNSMDIGAHTINAASGSSYEDFGLTPNTTYYYRARYTQSNGQTSDYSSIVQATTSSIPTNTQSAWRGAASAASTNSTGVTSLSLSKGSTQVGDIVGIIVLVCNNTTAGSWAVPTFPAGFSTPVEIESDVNGYNKGFLVFKKAGSAEPDNYTVTYSHPNGTYRITAIRFTRYGHDDTNWLDQTPVAVFNNTVSSNINLPSITPVGSDGAELISIAMTTDGNSNLWQVNILPASGETEYAEVSDNSFYTTIQIASKSITGTSTIPARNATMPGFNAKSFGISVLLREPASAPPLPPPSGGNDGTLLPSNSPPSFNSLNNGILSFDGIEDFIRTSTQLDSTSFPQFSIGIWFETDTANGAKLIGFESNQTGSSSSYDRHLYIGTDGKLYFGIYKDGYVLVSTDYTVNDETWHYAVAVYDGLALKLYMNGSLINQTALTTPPDNYTGYWRIGGGTISGWTLAGSNPLFKGNIGTVHTYSRALTPTEVLTNYNARKGRYISGAIPTVSIDSKTSNSITVRVQITPETGFLYPKFVVQRSSSVNGPWVTLPTINAPATTVTDTGLASATTYYYRTKAIRNDNKNTEWSVPISIVVDGTVTPVGEFNPPWPRLGGYPLNNQNYELEANRAYWANRSLLTFSHWDGWESGRSMNMRDIIADMRSRQDPSVGGLEVYPYIVNEALESETRCGVTSVSGTFQLDETVYIGSSLGSATFKALVDRVTDWYGDPSVFVNVLPGETVFGSTPQSGQTLRGASSGATATITGFYTGESFEPWKKVNDSNWWLYRVGNSGTRARSFFDTKQWMPNNSAYCPVVGGDIWTEWHAQYAHNFLFNGRNEPGKPFNTPNPNWAGIFWDNVFAAPFAHSNNPSVDWDRDGTDDGDTDSDIVANLTLGFRKGWERYRQLRPNGKVIGNIGAWVSLPAYYNVTGGYNQGVPKLTSFDYTVLSNYVNQVDGGLLENAFDDFGGREGQGIDPEGAYRRGWIGGINGFNGFEARANQFRFYAGIVKSDRIVCSDHTIYHDRPSDNSNFQRLRYGLATTSILSNFWYYPTNDPDYTYNAGVYHDFDEFTNGGTSYGWIGYPDTNSAYGSRQVNPYQNGVYRRDFTNAIVLVNPPGNGVQTVTLPFNVRKIQGRSGKSDLSVNNGQTITAGTNITLQDRDGLFLLKV